MKSKKTALIFVAVLIVIVLLYAVVEIASKNRESSNTTHTPQETTELIEALRRKPDFDENIFEDEVWLDQNRYITYVNSGLSLILTDENYSDYGEAFELMCNYVDAVIMGDKDRLIGYYTDNYFDSHEMIGDFTMQKLYDVKIEQLDSGEKEYGGEDVLYVQFKLSYKIMENNKTFRSDILSDGEKPQYYLLIDSGDGYKIAEIADNLIQD